MKTNPCLDLESEGPRAQGWAIRLSAYRSHLASVLWWWFWRCCVDFDDFNDFGYFDDLDDLDDLDDIDDLSDLDDLDDFDDFDDDNDDNYERRLTLLAKHIMLASTLRWVKSIGSGSSPFLAAPRTLTREME